MKWFQKIKEYFIEEELEEEVPVAEPQPHIQPEKNNQQQSVASGGEQTPYEEKKNAFRFPLELDSTTQPIEGMSKQPTPETDHNNASYTYKKEQNLTLPAHLQQKKDVYDVEVSGIRELLERRQKGKGYSRVIRSSGEEIIHYQVTPEEKKYFKQENKVEVDPKFINPLENRKRFVPTDVPSPVYGFQKPQDIHTLLSQQSQNAENARTHVATKIAENAQHLQHEEELEETNVDIVVHPTNDLSTNLMMHDLESTQHTDNESRSQVDFCEETNDVSNHHIDDEQQIESLNSQEQIESVVTEESLEYEKQDEQPLTDGKLEPAVQHVTIENSTIHIAQMHVEQMPMQPQVADYDTPKPVASAKTSTSRGRLPFNVLMLKTDKQKLAARQMVEQFQFTMQKQPLVAKQQETENIDCAETEDLNMHQQPEMDVHVINSEIDIDTVIQQQQSIIEHNPTNVELAHMEQQADNVEALYFTSINQAETSQHTLDAKEQTINDKEEQEPNLMAMQLPIDELVSATGQVTNEKKVVDVIATDKEQQLFIGNDSQLVETIATTQQSLEEEVVDEEQQLSMHKQEALFNSTIEQVSPFQNEQSVVGETKPIQHYEVPPLEFLTPPEEKLEDREWMDEQGDRLVEALSYFQVQAQIESIVQGPAVTQFEITVGHGTKVSKVRNLSDDIKLALAAKDIRIDAPIPGKRSIGIEIPNRISRAVRLSEVTNSAAFKESASPMEAALGLDLTGKPVTIDLRKMPHGLIAGATGSGKSVCINSILVSLLYKAAPHELKLMLIDPKMVELAPFNDIPHLVSPVITDVKAATAALKWAVEEMERRYQLFMHANVRDITRFNKLADEHGQYAQKLPYLLIVIDELADLMMMSPADVEEAICRIAQKARACGIHLILATQRPSVDVITGTIKSNIPTRIAFAVSSQIDSRTILDSQGAERLLGRGDMLYLGNGSSAPVRIQGTFVTDEEIEEVIAYVRKQGEPDYIFKQDELLKKAETVEEQDELFEDVCRFVFEQGTASTSSIQRRYHIGYNRAARLVDMLERQGFVSEQKGSKPRDVFITESDLIEIFG